MATFLVPTRSKTNYVDLDSTQNLVHPEWELSDPCPDIYSLFRNFNGKFFLGKLHCVELEWSKKMYQCAGICYLKKSSIHMACTIRLSEPLLKLRSRKELIETLLHEMIHAWNFVLGIYEENGGHGKNFKAKMEEINRKAGTNITVYHTFHEEVELYKKHWWKCDGPCSKNKPYYGIVKRVSNRAPGPNDFWWAQHEKTCGGKFIKFKEPEKTEKKKKEKKTLSGSGTDIRKYFPVSPRTSSQSSTSEIEDDDFETDDFGVVVPKDFTKPLPKPVPTSKGNVLGGRDNGKSKLLDNQPGPSTSGGGTKLGGGAGNGRSRLIDMYEKIKTSGPSEKKIKLENPGDRRKSMSQKKILEEFDDDDDDIVLIDDEYDDALGDAGIESNVDKKVNELVHCPLCNKSLPIEEINNHLDECLNNDAAVVVID